MECKKICEIFNKTSYRIDFHYFCCAENSRWIEYYSASRQSEMHDRVNERSS